MILDVCVGSAGFYQQRHLKLEEEWIGIDIRKGDFTYKTASAQVPTQVIINPTVLADMKHLPFRENLFSMIIMDPPHTDAGLLSWLGKHYGSWTRHETIETLRKANVEFERVLKPHGSLILKLMPRQVPIFETLLKNFCFFYPSTLIGFAGPSENRKEGLTLQRGLLQHSNLN